MKKSQLFDVVCALTLFAMSSANATLIASDDISVTGTDQSFSQILAVTPPSFSDAGVTLDETGGSAQTQPDGGVDSFIDGASSESPLTDSRAGLWLLLIVAFVFGVLLEIFHRRSSRR